MSTIRTKITAAALATVTALGLAACGDSDTPDAPQASPTIDVPETHAATPVDDGAFMRADYGSEPVNVLNIPHIRAGQTPVAPGSTQAQRLGTLAEALGLDPQHWVRGRAGWELHLDALPWDAPEYASGTRTVFVPMTPAAEAAHAEDVERARTSPHKSTPLWQRLMDADAAPDLREVRDIAARYPEADHRPWQLTTCSAYTDMTDADQALVRDVFGPLAVDIPDSGWSAGTIGVILPGAWDAKLLPCNP